MSSARLIACHECDLLQRETTLASGGTARCRRCGATLYRSPPASVDRALAAIKAGHGAIAFGAAAVLTMFAATSFDPHLFPDAVETDHG